MDAAKDDDGAGCRATCSPRLVTTAVGGRDTTARDEARGGGGGGGGGMSLRRRARRAAQSSVVVVALEIVDMDDALALVPGRLRRRETWRTTGSLVCVVRWMDCRARGCVRVGVCQMQKDVRACLPCRGRQGRRRRILSPPSSPRPGMVSSVCVCRGGA